MTVEFYCKKAKVGKSGLSPIQAALSINGERKFINLPLKYNPEQFRKETETRRETEIKKYLDSVRDNINKAVIDMSVHGIPLTHYNLRQYMKQGGIKSYTLNDLFEEYLTYYRKRIGVDLTQETFNKYIIVRNLFFEDVNPQSELPSILPNTVRKFQIRLQSQYKTSTVDGMLTKLKSIFTYAFENGYMKTNPFSIIKIEKAKPVIEYLTEEEIKKLTDTSLDNKGLEKVRDCSLLQISTGLSYADLKNLRKEDIRIDTVKGKEVWYIKKDRVKTGIEYCTPILEEGRRVLLKYDFQVPVLTNQKQNCYLKVIGDLTGVNESLRRRGFEKGLHTHLFRKTFATRMLNSGVSLTSVSKMCGHFSEKTTQKFYVKTLDERVLGEVANLSL